MIFGPGKAADQPGNTAFFDEACDAAMPGTCIVCHDGQITASKVANPVDQDLGYSGLAKTSDKKGCTVLNPADRLLERC